VLNQRFFAKFAFINPLMYDRSISRERQLSGEAHQSEKVGK
jgi:hypothetical protein